MIKKNVYLTQPSFKNDNSVYIPYSVGMLASYAWQFDDIKDNYELKDVFFLRENTDSIVDSLEDPYFVGFSCYMWNYEYDLLLARKVKQRYPDCIIAFGGPQVPSDQSMLNEFPFIDMLMHYEGEVSFRLVLKALNEGTDLSQIDNLSFRMKDGEIKTTPFRVAKDFNFPSPYTSGFADKCMAKYPDMEFLPVLETNRGCPNRCSYCSWGNMTAPVRLFPLDRIFSELEWIAQHKMDYIACADANFGLFPRDDKIIDKVIDLYKKYGFPCKFQVSYSKDTGDRVFEITRKLSQNGMDKGVTLSFQSMSPIVQKNIGRSNMDIDYYKTLLRKYTEAKIPTYTDLILGLPGETVESFIEGIDELLDYGQHNALFVHLCEWLPLSDMGNKDYMEKFGLKYTVVPINQPHMTKTENDEAPEHSRIITSTASMNTDEWKTCVLYATCVLSFHHFGLLQFIAMFLHNEHGVRYSSFYRKLLDRELSDKNSVFSFIKKRLDGVIDNGESVVVFDDRFGKVAWTFEEYAFLSIIIHKDEFYDSLRSFISSFLPDPTELDELLRFQSFAIKTIDNPFNEESFTHDWLDCYKSWILNDPARSSAKNVRYRVIDPKATYSWPEYAKKVLWFGRRGGTNLYVRDNMTEVADNE